MAVDRCQRCGKPVEPPFRKYCSDACRDSHQRAQTGVRLPKGIPRKTYRYYDYRQVEEPHAGNRD